jgi:transposase-like protein
MRNLTLIDIAKITENEADVFKFVESLIWEDGIPVCPHCDTKGAYPLTPRPESKSPVRLGVWKYKSCRKQFTVRVGTIFEDSHIPLGKWLLAIHLMCASKKGISAHQLHREIGVTYKTAWFMCHRIRLAMRSDFLTSKLSGTVEVDETYVGGKPRQGDGKEHKRGRGTSKTPVLALVERDGQVRTKVIPNVTGNTLKETIKEQVESSSTIMTDEFSAYTGIGDHFKGGHHTVNHSEGEYMNGNASTNTAESFFSLLKRGIYGTWHKVSKEHLHRYTTEFEFRWDRRKESDAERMQDLMKMTKGKRLVYRKSIME